MNVLGNTEQRLTLKLRRDLAKTLKRGNPWVFADAIDGAPTAPAGTRAILRNRDGRVLGQGFYDPTRHLAFRMCALGTQTTLDEAWALARLDRAAKLRQRFIDPSTTDGFRLVNGEGDGMPGLVVDVYGKAAVVVLDGPGAEAFWSALGVAHWTRERLGLKHVYQRFRVRGEAQGQSLVGDEPSAPVRFRENGITFMADLRRGQKTGFFLDQRDNRQRVRRLATGCSVLNICGYTGGFSVYAFAGGAHSVTTVDRARPALDMASMIWSANGFPGAAHEVVEADMFGFLEQAEAARRRWDVVILDPPSFAPSKKTVPAAEKAYVKLIAAGARVTQTGGLLIAASCSSHMTPERFVELCRDGVGHGRARATLLAVHGQPADHPAPLALDAFRYLKFVVMRLER